MRMEPQFITMSACSSDAPHDGRLPPGNRSMGISALFLFRFAKHWRFDPNNWLRQTQKGWDLTSSGLAEAKMGIQATSRSKWKLWNTKGNYSTPGILET